MCQFVFDYNPSVSWVIVMLLYQQKQEWIPYSTLANFAHWHYDVIFVSHRTSLNFNSHSYFLELNMQHSEDNILIKNLWECSRFFCQNTDKNLWIRIGKDKRQTTFCKGCKQQVQSNAQKAVSYGRLQLSYFCCRQSSFCNCKKWKSFVTCSVLQIWHH